MTWSAAPWNRPPEVPVRSPPLRFSGPPGECVFVFTMAGTKARSTGRLNRWRRPFSARRTQLWKPLEIPDWAVLFDGHSRLAEVSLGYSLSPAACSAAVRLDPPRRLVDGRRPSQERDETMAARGLVRKIVARRLWRNCTKRASGRVRHIARPKHSADPGG